MAARKYWLGFNVIKGVGPVRLRALRQHFGDLETAWRASEADLRAAGLDQRTLASVIQRSTWISWCRTWTRWGRRR
jgi:DNA processing protein